MSRTNCTRLAFRLCIAAALTLLSAGSLTRVAYADYVIVSPAAPGADDTTAAASADIANQTFALDESYVPREPVKIAVRPYRERTFVESMIARWYRIRFRFYRTVHMYPRPYFDPMWTLEAGMGLTAFLLARRMGLMDESEEEQTA